MNKFIVVEVSHLDSEYVDDVKFVNSFESFEKAQEFIREEHKVSQDRAKERHEYIKGFTLTLPDEYRLLHHGVREKTLREIEGQIEFNKKTGKDVGLLEDYNPPEFI